jgi:hypothetical protein
MKALSGYPTVGFNFSISHLNIYQFFVFALLFDFIFNYK